jgi:hypothetical protein
VFPIIRRSWLPGDGDCAVCAGCVRGEGSDALAKIKIYKTRRTTRPFHVFQPAGRTPKGVIRKQAPVKIKVSGFTSGRRDLNGLALTKPRSVK